MTKDEALKMAIGKLVLEKMTSGNDVPVSRCTITNVEIHALSKEALEQPAQEPYGWYDNHDIHTEKQSDESIALYTHFHQWQGLTDEEIKDFWTKHQPVLTRCPMQFAHAIEQALKDRNHG